MNRYEFHVLSITHTHTHTHTHTIIQSVIHINIMLILFMKKYALPHRLPTKTTFFFLKIQLIHCGTALHIQPVVEKKRLNISSVYTLIGLYYNFPQKITQHFQQLFNLTYYKHCTSSLDMPNLSYFVMFSS